VTVIHPDYYKQFRTKEEIALDKLYEEHLDGNCKQEGAECVYCDEDQERGENSNGG
jgi:hypothetical protein